MPKKAAGENTKKAAGNAKKAEAANQKAVAEASKKASTEDAEWSKGAKSNAKKEAETAKRDEAARKKAENDALLAAEEKSARPTPKNAKTALKKTTRGLDLAQLDADAPPPTATTAPALTASNIDDALDALGLATTSANAQQVDRHPERRYKAAYAAYEARRLPELELEMKGLRRGQRVEVVRKEFEKSPENPFNQVSARFDTTREELREIREGVREGVEGRLGGGP